MAICWYFMLDFGEFFVRKIINRPARNHSLGGISMAPILAKTCAAAFPTSTCGKTKAVVVASFTKLRELAGKATSTSSQSHE